MQVKDLTSVIEEYAPLCLQEDYDNAGLICGDPGDEVSSVLITLDVTEAVVDEAIVGKHNLIIAHHPLFIKGLKKIVPDNYIQRCIIKAIRHGINIYAAHTNMDAVANGVSGRMADKLNMTNRRILSPAAPGSQIGFGIIGDLDSPINTFEFLQAVKTAFNCKAIRYTDISNIPQIKRVAVCGGSGASLLTSALTANADIYISGDFKYHDFFNTEGKIVIADIGHYESEQYTKDIFYELVTKKISKFAVQFSKVDTNPILYI